MNETNELNQEVIPGTTIPRPRTREVTETDQEYVEYLKTYYEKYFPEKQSEEVVTPIVEENNIQEAEISNDDLNNINNSLESYVDQIITQEQSNSEPVISEAAPIENEEPLFDVSVEEQAENDFSFDTKVSEEINGEPVISFDTSANTEEIVGFTQSNATLTSRIKTSNFYQKVVNFFESTKGLINKANDYLKDISDSLEEEELIPAVGRAR